MTIGGDLVRRMMRRVRPEPGETDYLGAQVARTVAKERRLIEAILADHRIGRIADIGCGPGHFTAHLAHWFPSASIVAVDHDGNMVAAARTRLEPQSGRINVACAPAVDTQGDPDSVDVVFSRLLYQHLPDPAAALREAWRILRPGGKLIIIDVDDGLFGVVTPAVDEVGEALRLYAEAQAARGGDRFIARKLPAMLAAAGFSSVDVDALAILGRGDGVRPSLPQLDPAPLDWLLREGRIDRPDRDRLARARETLIDRDTTAITTMFVVHAVKPQP